VEALPELLAMKEADLIAVLKKFMGEKHIQDVLKVCAMLPSIDLIYKLPSTLDAGSEGTLKIELNRLR
jgi:hypothetical protein